MKNIKWIIIFIMYSTVLLGCHSNSIEYELMQEMNNIVSIRIAEGISEKDALEGNYKKIKVIASVPEEQWESFLVNFQKISCSQYNNDPCQSLEGNIIWITYANGAIELIGDDTAFYHWIQEEDRGDFRPYYFNLEQFNSLITQYAVSFPVIE